MRGYGAFGDLAQMDYVGVDGFAKLVAGLTTGDWVKIAESIPAVNQDVVAPLINAGSALHDFLESRSDDEAVAAGRGIGARSPPAPYADQVRRFNMRHSLRRSRPRTRSR